MPYRIEFSSEAEEHLRALAAGQKALVLQEIEQQLRDQPTVATRNRKKMAPNPYARWELRIRQFRVLYNVEPTAEPVVTVRAVGVKVGNQFRFGKQGLGDL